LKEDASVIRERDIQADRRSRSCCQIGHAGYAAESLVQSELDYRIDVCRVTRGGHIECVRYHMKLYEFMQL
jgi:hypothetical protein